ncbi:hypothetical protein H0H93_007020 [Arthromyces matolae]|nr:hypothetical protein H0H93_007020 [Arthromyces matolae]
MKHMFYHVVIKDQCQASQLHQLVLEGAPFTTHIRKLTFAGYGSQVETSSGSRVCCGSDAAASLLRGLPRVISINILYFLTNIWHPALVDALLELFRVGQITEATFKSTSIPVNILRACASASSLTFDSTWVAWRSMEPETGSLLHAIQPPSIERLRFVLPYYRSSLNGHTFPVDVSRVQTLEIYDSERHYCPRSNSPPPTAVSGFLPAFRLKLTCLVCQCPFLGANDAFNLGELVALKSIKLLARMAEAADWLAGFLSKTAECRSLEKFTLTICDDLSQRWILAVCVEALKEADRVLHGAICHFPSIRSIEVHYITGACGRVDILDSISIGDSQAQDITDSPSSTSCIDLQVYAGSQMTGGQVENCITNSFRRLREANKLKVTVENCQDISVGHAFYTRT